jgi:hypothetical protein
MDEKINEMMRTSPQSTAKQLEKYCIHKKKKGRHINPGKAARYSTAPPPKNETK